MIRRTHLAIGLLLVLIFLPQIQGTSTEKIVFSIVLLVSSLFPDIDFAFSTLGKFKGFRFLQFFIGHRGIMHSLTFAIAGAFALSFFFPRYALAFFLGFGFHVFADSFTVDGVRPFWPSYRISNGGIRTGGITETTLFIFILILDALLFLLMIR